MKIDDHRQTEPLTSEARVARLRELAKWGVDLSLIEANLRRTPTERIAHMLAARDFGRALRQAYLNQQHTAIGPSSKSDEQQ